VALHVKSNRHERAVLRIGATIGVPEVLRELGSDPNVLLSAAGYDSRIFTSPDNQITLSARGEILERCARILRCSHFGLLVGSHAGLSSLGLVGLLAKHAPDVGSAIRQICRHFHLHAGGVAVDLKVNGGQAIFSYGIYEPGIPGVTQTCDGAVAAILNIMRELCGHDFKPTEAWFAHPRPEDTEAFRKILRVHLEFDAEVYALVFSASWLTQRLPPTDQTLSRLLQEKVVEQERLHSRSFPDQVQAIMRTALPFDQVNADRLAAMFDMHVRTFHRRLMELGTSHQELLDRTRLTVACQLLEDDRRSLSQIAELLGYSEMRSFIRAFKRWTGSTPSGWRRRRLESQGVASGDRPLTSKVI
jgi:AraC-like DNA-binding protein